MKSKYAVALWIATLVPCGSVAAIAAPLQDAPATTAAAPTWTIDQAVTCSVHDAWVLGGKTEEGFFAIVQAEAELAAQKRDLTLPNDATVGREFGQYIKTQAKADHDQLLYSIVDRAVRKYGTKGKS
jgi:hypothetical protein